MEAKGDPNMSKSNVEKWHALGQHSIRVEEPDIVHIRIVGDLHREEVEKILRFSNDYPQPEKGFFALIDIPRAGRPNLEILRSDSIVEEMRKFRAMVYYGAEFQHRTVIDIVQKIIRGLKLSLNTLPLVPFATEAEGRAWIDMRRAST